MRSDLILDGSHRAHVSHPHVSFDESRDLQLGRSPIRLPVLFQCLSNYENRIDALILENGFRSGFKIEYNGTRTAVEYKNLKSAIDNEIVLLEKIGQEVQLGRIAGPFAKPPLSNLRVSPVGLVPKASGGWRMISHLSFPEGSSINDGIEQTFCSVRYTSFDKVTDMIYDLGVGALLAKRDLKSAYRILPIRVEDFPLLGIKAGDKYYIDKFLPMGLSQSANLFEKFSTFLQWLVEKRSGMTTVDHLLDDFIFAGKHGSNACMSLVNTFEEVCKELGVPIATEKSIDPTTVMVFLGLEIDTNEMTIRVPSHKIEELTALLQDFLSRKKITLKQLQSLVGKLNFFSKAIRSSRAFLRRFYDAMLPLKKPHNFIRVAGEIKEDFRVWLDFLKHFNGVAYIPQHVWFSNEQLQLFTDSAGSVHLGAGCFFEGNWCFFPWPKEWAKTEVHKDLTFLEMVPVILT